MDTTTTFIPTTASYADTYISNTLIQTLVSSQIHQKPLVFFCIGTNQITGDALGPLIGSQLTALNLPSITVYGTWKNPVHAQNLESVWKYAKKKHPDSCFIAIDASFGPKTHLGYICIENSPVYPGQGVGKALSPVGDISITGIVCSNCVMRHRQLAHTPFSVIQKQANIITSGIFQTLLHLFILQKI